LGRPPFRGCGLVAVELLRLALAAGHRTKIKLCMQLIRIHTAAGGVYVCNTMSVLVLLRVQWKASAVSRGGGATVRCGALQKGNNVVRIIAWGVDTFWHLPVAALRPSSAYAHRTACPAVKQPECLKTLVLPRSALLAQHVILGAMINCTSVVTVPIHQLFSWRDRC
jgi:hypothetical protein